MNDIIKIVGDNLRDVRHVRNLTMDDVADMLMDAYEVNLSPSIIGAWERGERRISADHLFMLTQVLRCSLYTLFGIAPDVRVEAGILSDHERQIIEYMFNRWRGDTHALIQMMGMYMAGDCATRQAMASTTVDIFKSSCDRGMQTFVPYEIKSEYVMRKCNELCK